MTHFSGEKIAMFIDLTLTHDANLCYWNMFCPSPTCLLLDINIQNQLFKEEFTALVSKVSVR